jgi:biopolymer transport protein ExbD
MAKKKFKFKEVDLLPILNLMTVLIPVLLSITSYQKIGIVEVNLPERSEQVMNEEQPEPDDQALNLTVAVTNDYLQIVARGGMLPMIFYKEMWTFRCKADNDTITYDPAELGMQADGSFSKKTPTCRNGAESNKYEIETIHLWTLIKQSEEDPGTFVTSLYTAEDSAYVDGNNEFIPDRNGIQVGSVIATLRESSGRKITVEKFNQMKVLPRSAYDELAKALIGIHTRFIDAPDADNIIILGNDDTAFDKIINVMDRARDSGFWKINLAKLGG